MSLTKEEILSFSNPLSLFPKDKNAAKIKYQKLRSQWHPDSDSTLDPAVLANINVLYDKLQDLLVPKIEEFLGIEGKRYSLEYRMKRSFELGDMYIGNTTVVYAVTKSNKDLFDIAIKQLDSFCYSTPQMQEEFSRYFPSIKATFETKEHHVVVLEKTEDVFCLRDVLHYFKGKFPPKHVAWVINRLYNIGMYFKDSKIVHNALSLDTVFISPKYHSALIIGGWWYSRYQGDFLKALPASTLHSVPNMLYADKKATSRVDATLIKTIGLELLGDVKRDNTLPKPMVNWLQLPPSETFGLLDDFVTWDKGILCACFGPKTFVELNVTADNIYLI